MLFLTCSSLLGSSLCKSLSMSLCSWAPSHSDLPRSTPAVCGGWGGSIQLYNFIAYEAHVLKTEDRLTLWGHYLPPEGICSYFWKAAGLEVHHHNAARSWLRFILCGRQANTVRSFVGQPPTPPTPHTPTHPPLQVPGYLL